MNIKSITSVAVMTTLLAGSSAMADLVLSSSFEGDLGPNNGFGPGYISYYAGSTFSDGGVIWTVGGAVADAGVDQITGAYSPLPFPNGISALDMNAYNRGSITTNLVTVVGQSYLMTFSLSGNGVTGTVSALPGGTTFSGNNTEWQQFSVLFTATSISTIISFESLSPEGAGGTTLDNVVVQTIPVPAAAYVGLTGLLGVAGIGYARRRRA